MSMVVQHNMQAANANRMLGITSGAQAKSTEKLSSGYKINRAADDAAGLTISEKMRKQIRGLDKASSNAQDGVSSVQTAEGALTEVHSMLQRMNELAVQAANGTNSEDDRSAIQDEVNQLTTEIDRVSETTKFNEIYLLKGDAKGATTTNTIAAHDAGLAGKLVDNGNGTSTFTADALAVGDKVTIAGTEYKIAASSNKASYDATDYTATDKDKVSKDGVTYTYDDATTSWKDADGNTANITVGVGDTYIRNGVSKTLVTKDFTPSTTDEIKTEINKAANIGKNVTIKEADGTSKTYTIGTHKDETTTNPTLTADEIASKITGGQDVTIDTTKMYAVPAASTKENEISLSKAYDMMAKELKTASDIGTDAKTSSTVTNNGDGTFTIEQGKVKVKSPLSFSLHVGADADMTNKINVDIDSMSAAGLGIKGINVKDDSGVAATYAVDAIFDAISKVSSQRSALGAVQNRLEHTIDNLDNVSENTSSAESRIRDTDMAKEMVNYSKNNILAQAGQSMLAQANQSNQGVLSLLQ